VTEIAIFIVGTVLFFATTWATVAFGVWRVHQLQRDELSDRVTEIEDLGFTELHRSDNEASAASAGEARPSAAD